MNMEAWVGHALTLVLMMAALAGVYAGMKSQIAVMVSQLATMKEQLAELKASQSEQFELAHRRNFDEWHEISAVRAHPHDRDMR